MNPHHPPSQAGFSLIEMAISLALLGLLAGSLLFTVQAQRETRKLSDARKQLDDAREALIGFALSQGRLPCPAAPADPGGREDRADALSPCARQHGTLPWGTLALPALDPWGRQLTYYAHERFTGPVEAGATASFPLDASGNASIRNAASGGHEIASGLPAVIVCHGPGGAGAYLADGSRPLEALGDEAENADADAAFVSRTPDEGFDDLVAWVAPAILMARMVAAGRLP